MDVGVCTISERFNSFIWFNFKVGIVYTCNFSYLTGTSTPTLNRIVKSGNKVSVLADCLVVIVSKWVPVSILSQFQYFRCFPVLCLCSHLQTSSPTSQKSYLKFGSLKTTSEKPTFCA